MAANQILPFCEVDSGTNLLTQAEYAAAFDRSQGNQPGIASAKLVNKSMRQSSLIAAGIAQFLANYQTDDVVDTISPDDVAAMLSNSLRTNSFMIGVDQGVANAMVVTFTPPLKALHDGLSIRVVPAAANTGATTLNVDGLGALPVLGLAAQLLQGGELAGGMATLTYSSSGSWFLENAIGGALQVPDATKTHQAATLGQLNAALPAGMVVQFPSQTAPAGWLKLDGSLVSRATYQRLLAFAQIDGLVTEAAWSGGLQGRFSVGDGSTTMRLPDGRGMFTRGLDEGRGIDASRAFGSYQDQAMLQHNHGITDPTHNHTLNDPGHNHTINQSGHSHSTDSQGDHGHGIGDPGHAHNFQGNSAIVYVGSGGNANTAGGSNVVGMGMSGSGTGVYTGNAGSHGHNISASNANVSNAASGTGTYNSASGTGVSTNNAGAAESHPRNLAWPWYIKT